jgi:hypothetical protein
MEHHPDMPIDAFADVWRSLKEGQYWRALVKNRRKDCDHYWVGAKSFLPDSTAAGLGRMHTLT